jgi:hypothetical protein
MLAGIVGEHDRGCLVVVQIGHQLAIDRCGQACEDVIRSPGAVGLDAATQYFHPAFQHVCSLCSQDGLACLYRLASEEGLDGRQVFLGSDPIVPFVIATDAILQRPSDSRELSGDAKDRVGCLRAAKAVAEPDRLADFIKMGGNHSDIPELEIGAVDV